MNNSEKNSQNLVQQSIHASSTRTTVEHKNEQSAFEEQVKTLNNGSRQDDPSINSDLYYHEDRQTWATPHPESIRHGGGAHAGVLYTSRSLIRSAYERKYWSEIDKGLRDSNRGLGGAYRYNIGNLKYEELSQEAMKLYRWIRGYTDRDTLLWVASEEKLNLESSLAELIKQGAVENHPDYAGAVRRIARRL